MTGNLQKPITQEPKGDLFVILQEALAFDRKLTESGDLSRLLPGLFDIINRCNRIMGLLEGGGDAFLGALYIRLNAGALYCDAAVRLALLKRDSPEAQFWIGAMMEQAEKVYAVTAASSPTYSSQKALKSILESLLNSVCVTSDLQKPVLLDLIKRCGESIDKGFLSIKAEDDASMEALTAGVFMEASAVDFKNPSDRLVFLQLATRAFNEAAYGFNKVENTKFFYKAEEGLSRLADMIESAASEAAALSETQPEPSKTSQATSPSADCAKCNKPLALNAKFCAGCGTPVEKATAPLPPLPPQSRVCPNCNKQLGPNAKFCAGCGKPV
ncbi:MAG: zinc ribbon domain-containing protein [Nitrospirae bacterium]|nr:MAG: zinc ribbon domain-containing protein [Nitrospirota bacterium]